jgi:hypothetical protein
MKAVSTNFQHWRGIPLDPIPHHYKFSDYQVSRINPSVFWGEGGSHRESESPPPPSYFIFIQSHTVIITFENMYIVVLHNLSTSYRERGCGGRESTHQA